MNLPELCIRRPVMTTLLMAAFVIFGLIAYRALLKHLLAAQPATQVA